MTAQNSQLERVRSLYDRAASEERAARELLAIIGNSDSSTPVMLGYRAAGHMMMAKHVVNPFKKMSHFNKGKDYMSSAIKNDKLNLELRFLRFAVQAEAPGFLGYRGNLDEDKLLLLRGVKEIEDPGLKRMILNYLKTSKALSPAEKERL